MFSAMPPRKATAAQKGKSVAVEETSRAQRVTRAHAQTMPEVMPQSEGSTTPPVLEELGATAATTMDQETAPPAAPEPPAPEPAAPQLGAEYRAMRDAVQLLTRLVAAQANRPGPEGDYVDRRDSTRVRHFLTCNPPEFYGSKPDEDPHDFVRQMRRVLELVRASETESVKLASHRLRDVALNWYESWELSRGEGASPAVWDEFVAAFLSHFLPPELRRARVDRFLLLRQNGRSVREYSLEFDSLARYAPTIVADMADRMHRYVMGLDRYLIDGCMAMASQTDMDIARLQAYAQGMEDRYREDRSDRDGDRRRPKRARSARYFGEPRGDQPQQQHSGYFSQPALSTPSQFTGGRFDSAGPSGGGQSSRAPGSQTDRGSGQTRPPLPRCSHCGKPHFGECRFGTDACFACGRPGHIMRECPYRGGPGGSAQPTGSVAGSSSPSVAMRPTPAGRGRGRDRVPGSSGPSNRIYALAGRQDSGVPPNVDTGMLMFLSRNVYMH